MCSCLVTTVAVVCHFVRSLKLSSKFPLLATPLAKTTVQVVFTSLTYGIEPPSATSLRYVKQVSKKRRRMLKHPSSFFGDPYGNRTHVTAVKGPCLNRLTNGPLW